MTDIILIGSGGCMRELAWQIHESNRIEEKWNIIGYVDTKEPVNGYGIRVGTEVIPYLGNDNNLIRADEDKNVVISVGSSKLRKKIAEEYRKNPRIHFPAVVLRPSYVCYDAKMGQGCIVSMDCRISTNVKMGDFVFMNMGGMVCHDGMLEDFVTLGPTVKIAGMVRVGENTEIGMGANLIQGISVGANTVIGAGSVVIRDVERDCMAAGVPARVRG